MTIDGIMDGNYTTGKRYGQNYSLVNQSGARTTTIKFTGVEDLGGGNKANFRFEVQPSIIAGNANAFNMSTSAAGALAANAGSQSANGAASAQSGLVGKGYSYVGASGNFGEIQLGSINTAYLAAFTNASGRTGTGIGSMWNVENSIPDVGRVETAALYMTPTVAGFSGRYLIGTGNDSQYGYSSTIVLRRNTTNELSLGYAQGPLSLRYANTQVKASPNEAAATTAAAATSNTTTTYSSLSAAYTVGDLTLGLYSMTQKDNLGLDSSSFDRGTNRSTSMLYSSYQMGSTRLLLNTGSRKTNKAATNTGALTTSSSGVSLAGLKTNFLGYGIEYDLSKRTYVYFRGQTMTANDLQYGSAAVNGAWLTTANFTDKKHSLNAIGLSHSF